MRRPSSAKAAGPTRAAIAALDWAALADELDSHGHAVLKGLLGRSDCEALASLYADDARFRSRVVMARHGFGRGEYKYFDHPLPELVAELRGALYPPLSRIANRWNEAMRLTFSLLSSAKRSPRNSPRAASSFGSAGIAASRMS